MNSGRPGDPPAHTHALPEGDRIPIEDLHNALEKSVPSFTGVVRTNDGTFFTLETPVDEQTTEQMTEEIRARARELKR